MYILGIHNGHDSGAALVKDNQIIAAVNEERFKRIKHYGEFPLDSINYCLQEGGIGFQDIDSVAIATTQIDLQTQTYLNLGKKQLRNAQKLTLPKGSKARITRKTKSFLKRQMEERITELPTYFKNYQLENNTKLVSIDHHLAHAASCYYTSGFNGKCLIITLDGIGDEVTGTISIGENGKIRPLQVYGRKASLGFFYGVVTEALGWWVGNGEGKTMGLAPYGDPDAFPDSELKEILPQFKDGGWAKPHEFGLPTHVKSLNTYHWHFGDAAYVKNLIKKHGRENVAAKTQELLEEEAVKLIKFWVDETGATKVCSAGGVFLNVKLNQRIHEMDEVKDYYIFPNAGDGGLATGAALLSYYNTASDSTIPNCQEVYWGPEYKNEDIEEILNTRNINYQRMDDIAGCCAELMTQNNVVAWYQGRMEYGPRALGNRSILVDPRKAENKDLVNKKIKFREAFRPFCPSVLEESASDYMNGNWKDYFMITAFDVKEAKQDSIPAVYHVDNTSRPQMVTKKINPKYYRLIKAFGELTGENIILNTSFNLRGEPIINTPREAIKCFYDSGIDYLALGDFLIGKDG